MDRWTVDSADAGAQARTSFCASAGPARIARPRRRGRSARGKIYLNDREATMKDAGVALAAGDVVRTWMDRPGSAQRRPTLGEERDLPIVHEDSAIVVLNKPAGLLAVPLERRGDARSVYEDLKDYLAAPAASLGRSSSTGSTATRRAWCCLRKPRGRSGH